MVLLRPCGCAVPYFTPKPETSMIAQTPKNMPKTKQTVAIAAPWARLQVPEGHAFNSAILAKLVWNAHGARLFDPRIPS